MYIYGLHAACELVRPNSKSNQSKFKKTQNILKTINNVKDNTFRAKVDLPEMVVSKTLLEST